MATVNEIVRLAVDTYNGRPAGKYSLDESNKVVHEAIIAANNGKNYLDKRDIRDGKCGELFAIIEETIVKTVIDGLQGNEFFMNMVEYKNLKLGDTNEFFVPDDSLLYVDEVARGTQGLRRQRLNGGTRFTVNMKTYGVKVYEELDRMLSGRADINTLIDKVGQSLLKKQYDDIFTAWTSLVGNTGSTYIPVAGSYSEAALLELCEHVETNNGQTPVIMGTRAALRKITTATVSDSAKEDMYRMGYYGNFNGIPMIRINQIHERNTDKFLLPENQVYIIGVNTKPIKYVNEGEALIVPPTYGMNADFSEDYLFVNNAGIQVIIPDKKFGVYTMS
nr:MAG TPA: capsid protein [Caudoviricetes sp.]